MNYQPLAPCANTTPPTWTTATNPLPVGELPGEHNLCFEIRNNASGLPELRLIVRRCNALGSYDAAYEVVIKNNGSVRIRYAAGGLSRIGTDPVAPLGSHSINALQSSGGVPAVTDLKLTTVIPGMPPGRYVIGADDPRPYVPNQQIRNYRIDVTNNPDFKLTWRRSAAGNTGQIIFTFTNAANGSQAPNPLPSLESMGIRQQGCCQ